MDYLPEAKLWKFISPMMFLLLVFPPRSGGAHEPNPRFEHIGIEQGLSQNTVFAILQDSTGFLWFGTDDGLNRYDGYGFEILRSDPADSNSLSHNRIRSLLEDRDGLLWIGTRNGGLNRYDRRTKTFTHFKHDPDSPASIGADLVWTIHEDRSGTLWIGTGGGGLDRFEPTTESFHHLRHVPEDPKSLSDDFVKAIHEDRDGRLWVGTDEGLNRLDPKTETFERFPLDPRRGNIRDYGDIHDGNVVSAIHEDRLGHFWLGTQGGLARFDPGSSSFTYYDHDPDTPNSPDRDGIWDIHEDHEGTLWLSTFGGGLLHFNPISGAFSRHCRDATDPNGLSGDLVTVFFEDRSGAFWIGTSGTGLNKLSRMDGTFAHYGSVAPDSMVMTILEDRDEILWIGTWKGGLHRLDRSTGVVTRYTADRDDPTRLARDDVRAVLEDRHGGLWVGTEGGGLHRLNRSTGLFTRHQHDPEDPDTLRDDDAWVLLEDRDGTLWVGTYGGGLSRFNAASETFEHFRHDPADSSSLTSDVVRALFEDAVGRLWVGTSAGLSRLDDRQASPSAARFTRFRHGKGGAASLSSDEVLSILEDRAGNLWLGTHGGGLNRIAANGSEAALLLYYTTADGLPSNVVYGILEDDQGCLWMSTNRGLSRFDPTTESFRNYDTSDGLESNEFNSGAYFKSPQGEMFLGGLKGVNSFFPDQISGNTYVPPVVLTSFRKFNEEVATDSDLSTLSSVTLAPDENVFSFEFAALSFVATQRNEYAYRLLGFRNRWIELGTKRDVTFTNLNPGQYTLEVKASSSDGIWNEQGLEVGILVEPPFWRTGWFMASVGLAVLALLWVADQAKTRSMRKHNMALQAEITERQRAEHERERLIQQLEVNYGELEARNVEMERFTYTVSHDLKAPLITIKGFLGLLGKDIEQGDAERTESDMARIRQAAEKMHVLLDDLLKLSRIGRRMNPPETASLTDLVEDSMAQLAAQIADRGVGISVDPSMPEVHGDRLRLREVYENLIGNAVKFTGEREAPRVEIGARASDDGDGDGEGDGDDVLCWVRDNGIGIDAQYQGKIFGLFERLDAEVDGTGVGLALVKRIVEVHGGRIWVESEGLGEGSTFFFTLPASATSHDQSSLTSARKHVKVL